MSTFRTFMAILLSPIIATAVNAHEYWIEPDNYHLNSGQALTADTRVGQMFDGVDLSYSQSRVVWRRLANATGVHDVPGQDGDMPAFDIPALPPGLNILTMQTFPSSLSYDSWEKFESFVNKEGLEWVVDEHRKRQLPESGFVEIYTRFCKSLVQMGNPSIDTDHAVGLDFEWVLQNNPSAVNPQNKLNAQLLLRGEPLANALASVFIKQTDESAAAERVTIRTDQHGLISLPHETHGEILLSAIHMEPIDFESGNGVLAINTRGPKTVDGKGGGEKLENRVLPQGTVWHSLWASLTFSLPAR